MSDVKEWGQTILCKPDDDPEFLFSMMEQMLERAAERRGEVVVGEPVRKELAPGIAASLYEGINPEDRMLGVYVKTEART